MRVHSNLSHKRKTNNNNIPLHCVFCENTHILFGIRWMQTMIFDKMKRNYFVRLFSIVLAVLAVYTIQDGLIVSAANAPHKGMNWNNKQDIQCTLNVLHAAWAYWKIDKQIQNKIPKIEYNGCDTSHERLYKSTHFNILFHE